MRCYRCGSVLSDSNLCNGCGADVKIYKRIIKLSNTYYNMGLEKARIRDLSGAADILRRSVRMDKKNIQARNLLGLVYYEMGEVVEALSQWVISKNIQPEKNIADDYIREVQSNPTKLESMNTTIKKYNTALSYAKEDSDDLAIIQLKKVVSLNPRLVKAYQLLALLYMKRDEYGKAKKYLTKSLAIDTKNTLSMKYLGEIEKLNLVTDTAKKPEGPKEKKPLSGNDVIIPENSYKDVNYGLMQFITVVVGILIGAAMVYFLITPAKENRAAADYKETINEYSENISKLNISLGELQSNLDTLTAENERLKESLSEAAKVEDITAAYTSLLEAAELFAKDDKAGCAMKLLDIGDLQGKSAEYMALYNALKEKSFEEAYKSSYNAAYQAENSSRYNDAIEAFKICERLQPENLEILYHLGKNYVSLNNGAVDDTAKAYFSKVVELGPGTNFAGWAANYLK